MSEHPNAPGSTVMDGELVDSTEGALAKVISQDLDAGLAVALSEAEINQQIATARKFPRSLQRAIDNIKELSTYDTETALSCHYSLPRGRDPETGKAKAITGPSVRFAELVAQQWGNCRVAARVVATDRKEKFVEAEGIYHDLETNYAVKMVTRRRISGKNGHVYNDDMINVTGNAAASIALRNAILRGVPKPIWMKAYAAVEGVIRGDVKTLGARRVDLLTRFTTDLGLKADQVYAILGVKGENDIGLDELVVAAGFFTALRNNEVTVEDLLRQQGPAPAATRSLDSAFGAKVTSPNGDQVDQKTGEVEEPKRPAKEHEPAKEGLFEAAGDKAEPDKAKDSEPQFTEPLDGYAGDPDELYHFAGDAPMADGRRVTYKDGVAFSSAKAGRQLPVYKEHPPAEEEQVTPPAETTEGAQPSVQDPVHAQLFNAFAADMREAPSWSVIKTKLASFKKTEAYQVADEALQDRAQDLALETTQALVAAGKETVTPDSDVQFYALWLRGAEPHEVRPMFSKLVRTPVYQGLSDAQKDMLADATANASGEV